MAPSNDERTLAALAHASIVTNGAGLIGLVASAAIWATQRERSTYVRGHAIQALVYQGVVLLIALVMTLSWAMCVVLSLLPMALRPELYVEGTPPGPFWLALSGMLLPVLFALVATIYGLVGAFQAYRGRPFFYPVIGRIARVDLAESMPAPPSAAPVLAPAVDPAPAAPSEETTIIVPAGDESAEPKPASRSRKRGQAADDK